VGAGINAYILGAGSTRGTLANLSFPPPTAAGFGATISRISGWRTEFPALEQVAEYLERPLAGLGLEAIWSCFDYYAKFERSLPPKPWEDESRTLKRALLRLYGRQCDSAAESLPDTDSYTLGDIVKNRLDTGGFLISFNYATVAERLVRRFSRRPLRMVCSGEAMGAVWLVKPHGSTSWRMEFENGSLITQEPDGSPRYDSLTEEELMRPLGKHYEPLLLGAVPIKSELIREVQRMGGFPLIYDRVMDQWESVVAALRSAESLVVLGYSFPEEDQYGRFFFREGIRLRTKPLSVEFYELPENAAATAKSIFSALASKGLEVIYRGPVIAPLYPYESRCFTV